MAAHTYTKCVEDSEDFDIFLEYSRAKPQSGGRDLLQFLETPLKRINEYLPLFTKLLQYTPEDHPDYPACSALPERLETLVQIVHERKRSAENEHKINEIQKRLDFKDGNLWMPTRKFIREGWLRVSPNKGKVEDRYFYLFSDMLMYCKYGGVLKKNMLVVKEMIPLGGIAVAESQEVNKGAPRLLHAVTDSSLAAQHHHTLSSCFAVTRRSSIRSSPAASQNWRTGSVAYPTPLTNSTRRK